MKLKTPADGASLGSNLVRKGQTKTALAPKPANFFATSLLALLAGG